MKPILALLLVMVFSITSWATRPQPTPPYCGGVNGECVQLACFYNHCDFESNLEAVTEACTGVYDATCVRTICNQRGSCSFLSSFVKYARLCAGRNY